MIDDLLIINDTGALLYHWYPDRNKKEKQVDLLSGFLTAIDSFAKIERGEDIKSLKLKETLIIFEKTDKTIQNLTIVITTKDESMLELLHSFVHDVMDKFIEIFKSDLDQKFDGAVAKFQAFDDHIQDVLIAHGLDVLEEEIGKISEDDIQKSIIILEPKSGSIFYIFAKQYVNRENLSFLIPLILNSGHLLYQINLNEKVRWILLNTAQNENLVLEPRNKIIIVRQYKLSYEFEEDYLSLEFFKEKDKYVKKPQKLTEKFATIEWDSRIKQIFLVDLMGKVFYSKIMDPSYDCTEYIPETISFLTSSKKVSNDIYNRTLFNTAIGGERTATICVNFNNFALVLIGNVTDLSNFTVIQTLCLDIYKHLR